MEERSYLTPLLAESIHNWLRNEIWNEMKHEMKPENKKERDSKNRGVLFCSSFSFRDSDLEKSLIGLWDKRLNLEFNGKDSKTIMIIVRYEKSCCEIINLQPRSTHDVALTAAKAAMSTMYPTVFIFYSEHRKSGEEENGNFGRNEGY